MRVSRVARRFAIDPLAHLPPFGRSQQQLRDMTREEDMAASATTCARSVPRSVQTFADQHRNLSWRVLAKSLVFEC